MRLLDWWWRLPRIAQVGRKEAAVAHGIARATAAASLAAARLAAARLGAARLGANLATALGGSSAASMAAASTAATSTATTSTATTSTTATSTANSTNAARLPKFQKEGLQVCRIARSSRNKTCCLGLCRRRRHRRLRLLLLFDGGRAVASRSQKPHEGGIAAGGAL